MYGMSIERSLAKILTTKFFDKGDVWYPGAV